MNIITVSGAFTTLTTSMLVINMDVLYHGTTWNLTIQSFGNKRDQQIVPTGL